MAPRLSELAVPLTPFGAEKIPTCSARSGILLLGVGVGVGIGLLVAPASGEEMRADITPKVSDLGDEVRERTGKKPQGAAIGTYDE
jgi:YtxH-like protein